MTETQTLGADFLTRVGFSKEQAAQWRGEWDQAVGTIQEHGSRLAAKVILSPIGSVVFNGGADIAYRLGRVMDPRRTGNTDVVSNISSIFGSILGQRSGTLPPPGSCSNVYSR